ncbi:hypothetical protein HX109_03220 [Galbibacter sp. BG1]|uniref:C-type lectin domain-containing protein n=1 Tax=Galbibacter sp. BG1 TaxID=1170699 RepID=UPI0015C04450|nr:C-type lectin domain-containing protein [Galbibacter sp. BG1]QLE00617.1 hypothetical protein HX109_03220 [Galbibacter sp. BG1]
MKQFYFLYILVLPFCLTAQNQPPTISAENSDGASAYCPGTSSRIAKNVIITNNGGGNSLSAAFIQITGNYKTGDRLNFTNTSKITGTFSNSEGKLKLSGEATFAEYKAAIESITFTSTASFLDGLGKTFSIVLNEANYLERTGHYYEYIANVGITWTAARTAAEGRTLYGLKGYLATITTPEEAQLLGKQAPGAGWIGGSDAAVENVWRWVTGPEGTENGGTGRQFWQGLYANHPSTPGSTTAPDNFAFWNNREPNQAGDEDYAHITAPGVGPDGSWNDLSNRGANNGNYQPKGYLVEYGGMPGDPAAPQVATTTKLTVEKVAPTASNPAAITANCKPPAPNVNVVLDEADNCTVSANLIVQFVSDVENNTNPKTVTRTYSITDRAGNSSTVTQNITINEPSVDAGEDQEVCNGDSVTLPSTITNGTAPYTYEWSTNGTVVGNSATINTIPNGDADNNVNLDYTITVTDAAGCSYSDTVRIRVKFTPEASVTPQSATCGEDNGSFVFNFPDKNNRSNISFSIDGGISYSSIPDNNGSFTIGDLAPGDYELWSRWGNNDCPIKLGDFEIERTPEVLINSQPNNQTVFVNQDAKFSVDIENADTYQWQVSKDNGVTFNNISDGMEYENVNTEELTVLKPDVDKNKYQYRLTAEDSANNCELINSNSATLTVQLRTVITNRNQTYRVNKN